jgi:cell division protein FtsZ
LFNVTGGNDLSLFEVNQAAAIIKETAHPDVNLIFGAVIDPNMGDQIRITVIATGFDSSSAPKRMLRSRMKANKAQIGVRSEQESVLVGVEAAPNAFNVNVEDLDIPTFLRKRVNK